MQSLVNKTFHSIFRAADMLCLNIGNELSITVNDKKRIVSEFSFHIQTQWRFLKDGEIILASRDIYEPFCDGVGLDWDYDVFGRKKEESSIFDALRYEFNEQLKKCIILDCSVSPLGDLKILFSDGIYFETFMPASRKMEVWRLINFASGEHTIIFDVE